MKREDIEQEVVAQLCDYCLSRTDTIMEIFDKQQADLLESYKAITDDYITDDGYTDFCIHCDAILDKTFMNHKDNCIVLKAENYIKEHE
jgi:hypothetical protein